MMKSNPTPDWVKLGELEAVREMDAILRARCRGSDSRVIFRFRACLWFTRQRLIAELGLR